MALARRNGQRFNASIWPGFVDAMTALLLVLIFVLTIFMVVQSIQTETITDQETDLDRLSREVTDLSRSLGLSQQRAAGLEDDLDETAGVLAEAQSQSAFQSSLIDALTLDFESRGQALNEAENRITSFETQVATLLADRDTARAESETLRTDLQTASSLENTLRDDLAAALLLSQGLSSDLDAALAESTNLGADLVAARANSASLSADLDAARAQNEDLDRDLASERASGETLRADLDETQTRAAELDNNVADLSQRRDALETALAATRDEVSAEQEAARLAAARREALDALIADLRAEAARREAEMGESREALSSMRETLAVTRDDLGEMQDALDESQTTLADTRSSLDETQTALSDAEVARLADAAAAAALRERLANADAEMTAMTLALEAKRKEAEDTLTLLAASRDAEKDIEERLMAALLTNKQGEQDLDAARTALEEARERFSQSDSAASDLKRDIASALAARLSAEEEVARALSNAERDRLLLSQAQDALSGVEAVSAEDQRRIALLNEQVAQLRADILSLRQILGGSDARETAAVEEIEDLQSELQGALARVAVEQKLRADLEAAERERLEGEKQTLETYRSEFFGRLREILGDQQGVQVVGDRFVFSSEVLFASGSADLSLEGQREVAKVALILEETVFLIPANINWVIRVDGHTDDIPISGGRFDDNWELSQARALSVVRYMIDVFGFPSERLAAAGFAEFQPVDPTDSAEARARNRRIELKLTER